MVRYGHGAQLTMSREFQRVSVVDGHDTPLFSALLGAPPSGLGSHLAGLLLLQERLDSGSGNNLNVRVVVSAIKEEVTGLLQGKIVVGHVVEGNLVVLGL